MIGRQFKCCSRCQQSKPLTAFYRNAGTRNGRAGKCKECKNVYNSAARLRLHHGRRPGRERNRRRRHLHLVAAAGRARTRV